MAQQIPCATCGAPFAPRTSGGKPQVRCSEKCRRKAANAQYIEKNAPIRAVVCAECGKPVIQAKRGRPRRFCSQECKARVGNRALQRRMLPIRDPNPQSRICVYCGHLFIPKRRDQTYCSNSAAGPYCAHRASQARRRAGEPLRQVEQTKTCVECGEAFTAYKSNAKWCSQRCRSRTAHRDAGRRRGPVRPEWVPYADREIFERDGWICRICLESVDREAKRTHPDGATIDHVTPLSRGGSDEPGNVVTAHWRCNRDKGNRTVG